MVLQERFYTVDELEEIENLPENEEKIFELIGGVIYEMVRPTPLHTAIIMRLSSGLHVFVDARDLGHVFPDGVCYYLSKHDRPVPDTSFISKERLPVLPEKITIAPDLAVEVFSPSNREREMQNKIEVYLRYGTKRVWVIYPETRLVEVWRKTADGALMRLVPYDGELDGEDVLPGFRIAVKDLFPQK